MLPFVPEPVIGLCVSVTVKRERTADVGGHAQHAQHMRRVGDEHRAVAVLVVHEGRRPARIDWRVVRLVSSARIASSGTSWSDGVLAGTRGLRGPIALALAPGHDDPRRDPFVVERDGVIEPGREQRGGAAVVLGRAHDHDGIRGAALIAAGLVPDAVRRVSGHGGRGDDPDHDDANKTP